MGNCSFIACLLTSGAGVTLSPLPSFPPVITVLTSLTDSGRSCSSGGLLVTVAYGSLPPPEPGRPSVPVNVGTLVFSDGNWLMVSLLSCAACWKACAKAVIESKRSSGFFASACKITASTSIGRKGMCALGGCGSLVKCWYMICPGPP